MCTLDMIARFVGIVLYLHIYLKLLAIYNNHKRFQCKRGKRAILEIENSHLAYQLIRSSDIILLVNYNFG